MHRLPSQLQEHGHQNVRSRLLQGLCRGATHLSISQMPQLQPVLRKQRPHAYYPVILSTVPSKFSSCIISTLLFSTSLPFFFVAPLFHPIIFLVTFCQVHGAVFGGCFFFRRIGLKAAFDEFPHSGSIPRVLASLFMRSHFALRIWWIYSFRSWFFSCGAGALSERAVLSLDTLFPERRTVFLFSPSACDSRYLVSCRNTMSGQAKMGYDECKCMVSCSHCKCRALVRVP